MFKGVVQRVVTAAVALAAEREIERSDAQVLQERRVVGAGTQRRNAQIFSPHGLFAFFRRLRIEPVSRSATIGDRQAGLRISDVAQHLIDKVLKRVTASYVGEASAVAVGVQVGYGVLIQLFCMLLNPFG